MDPKGKKGPSNNGRLADIAEAPERRRPAQVVAVTGGGDFLGQHLVKLLRTRATDVECVRVLDILAFKQQLEYSSSVEAESLVGSVTSLQDVLLATQGAATVFHLDTFNDTHMFPDLQLARLVNLDGTRNVVAACRQNGVQLLVYVSDVTTVMGVKGVAKATEDTTPDPKPHLFPDAQIKSQAEKLVIEANWADLGEGRGRLRTVVLRLVQLYGELDSVLLPTVLTVAQSNCGQLPCVGSLQAKAHLMYAGNAAWAALCVHNAFHAAMQTLSNGVQASETDVTTSSSSQTILDPAMVDADAVSATRAAAQEVMEERTREASVAAAKTSLREMTGRAFFVCDDTPPINLLLFVRPLLARYGFFLTSWTVPEKWARLMAQVVYAALWLLYPFVQFNPLVSTSLLHQLCHTYTFADDLFRRLFAYRPLHTRPDSIRNTVAFYDACYKESMTADMVGHALESKHVGILRRMSRVKLNIATMDLGDSGKQFRLKALEEKHNSPWTPVDMIM